jgi:hypothetical protein
MVCYPSGQVFFYAVLRGLAAGGPRTKSSESTGQRPNSIAVQSSSSSSGHQPSPGVTGVVRVAAYCWSRARHPSRSCLYRSARSRCRSAAPVALATSSRSAGPRLQPPRPRSASPCPASRCSATVVAEKLSRAGRSPDARQIGDSLVAGGIRLFPRGVAGPSPRRYRAARLTRTRARLTRLAARRLSRSPAGSSASSARNSSTNMGCMVFSTGITGRGAAAGRAGHAWPAAAAPAREAPARTATPRWRFRWWPADRGQQRFPGTRQFPFPGGLTLSPRHVRACR